MKSGASRRLAAIHLGGGVVRLRGPGVDRWVAGLGPFLDPRPADFEAAVDVEVGDPIALAGAFTHRRFDLAFAMTAGRGRAIHDGHPDGLLAILELAVAAALADRGDGLLLHAAAGTRDRRAWLMPGPSGTGKSTAARAGRFDRVLSDERIIARRGPAGWIAHGTPWWSSGRALPLDPEPSLIGGVVALRHGDPDAPASARPLAPDAAAALLLGSVSLYAPTPDRRRAAFELACDLAAAAPALEVAFRPDHDFTALLGRDQSNSGTSSDPSPGVSSTSRS